jgi:hypothetical protein
MANLLRQLDRHLLSPEDFGVAVYELRKLARSGRRRRKVTIPMGVVGALPTRRIR